jgi:hypothetical protein
VYEGNSMNFGPGSGTTSCQANLILIHVEVATLSRKMETPVFPLHTHESSFN